MARYYEVKLSANYMDENFVDKETKYCKNDHELDEILKYFFWDSELYPKVEKVNRTIYMHSYIYYDVVYGSYVELLAVLIPITKFKYRKKKRKKKVLGRT